MQSEVFEGLHVAIIMDGNGRWATRRGLPRVAGHRAGVAAVRRVVKHAPDVGINRLTLYAFSSDNWSRPAGEVQSIFRLMRAYLRLETERLRKAGVRLQIIGRRDRLPKLLLREIDQADFATAGSRRFHLRVAVDYSSRDAITRAVAQRPFPSMMMATCKPSGNILCIVKLPRTKKLGVYAVQPTSCCWQLPDLLPPLTRLIPGGSYTSR